LVDHQAQGSDFIKYRQDSPKWAKVFTPEEPVKHGCGDEYNQDAD